MLHFEPGGTVLGGQPVGLSGLGFVRLGQVNVWDEMRGLSVLGMTAVQWRCLLTFLPHR